jgi:peptide/nickel transport system ATP-binding protein
MKKPFLQLERVHIAFGEREVVHDLSLDLFPGERLGIVGESGSGKSVTALSIMGLLPPGGHIAGGRIQLATDSDGLKPIHDWSSRQYQKIRGTGIGMIFQEPMHTLNPVIRCGPQIMEAIRQEPGVSKAEAKEKTFHWMERVGLTDLDRMYRSFPHLLSGGQKQRLMIAMALCRDPELLIADEPTTALDLHIQRQIIDLILALSEDMGLSVLFISHDLGVVRKVTHRIVVMEKGYAVETGTTESLFNAPQHPYTRGLLACRPPIDRRLYRLPTIRDFADGGSAPTRQDVVKPAAGQSPILSLQNVSVRFQSGGSWFSKAKREIRAVDEVSGDVYRGQTLGLVGESGSGKTTLGRTIVGLQAPTAGRITFDGIPLAGSDRRDTFLRKRIQMIFQDPYSALNPRMTIGKAITEPLKWHFPEWTDSRYQERMVELLEQVGLEADHQYRFPQAFSGGQRQRICIARALAPEPDLLVCDESVSALDVSVQAQVLNVLKELQDRYQLTYVFISHDMSVIRFMADQIMVLKDGQVQESGPADQVFSQPQSSYTQSLLDSVLL